MKKINSGFLLIPILILATFISYIPHINYPYPLHVDEWFHISQAKEVVLNQSTDWYSGQPFQLGLERGWHLTLTIIQGIFNLNITQWSYVPIFLQLLAIISVYLFVLKTFGEKLALISAFLVALIPSNVTIGGPVFLVPVNLSLIFIPIALYFAFKARDFKDYLFLLLPTLFLLYSHPPSAMVLLISLAIYSVLNLKDNKRRSRNILLTIVLAILLSLPNYVARIEAKGLESIQFPFWITLSQIPLLFGLIPTLFFLLGFYHVSKTRNKELITLLLTTIILLIDIVFYVTTGSAWLIPYQRVFIPLMLFMSIIAAYGLNMIKDRQLLVIVLILIFAFSLQQHLNTPYYHIIDDSDYQNFLWIKENTPNNAKVLLDPWLARAFPPIAERQVFTVMPFGPNEEIEKQNKLASDFLSNNCTDTSFLRANNITVVYSKTGCNNPDLQYVHNNTYFLK